MFERPALRMQTNSTSATLVAIVGSHAIGSHSWCAAAPTRAMLTVVSVTRLTVRVHPRAARERKVWDGAILKVWVRQPPVHGDANTAIIDHVAHWLKVPRSCVRIVSGHTSRSKLLDIEGVVTLPPSDTLL